MATKLKVSELADWIENQPENTEETPYEIELIDARDEDLIGQNAYRDENGRWRGPFPSTISRPLQEYNRFANIKLNRGITTIGNLGLAGNFVSIYLPNGTETIENNAIGSSSVVLRYIYIPDSVTEIGEYAFGKNVYSTITFYASAEKGKWLQEQKWWKDWYIFEEMDDPSAPVDPDKSKPTVELITLDNLKAYDKVKHEKVLGHIAEEKERAEAAEKALDEKFADYLPKDGTVAKALEADKATTADSATVADNVKAGGTAGQVLTSNGPDTEPTWKTPTGGSGSAEIVLTVPGESKVEEIENTNACKPNSEYYNLPVNINGDNLIFSSGATIIKNGNSTTSKTGQLIRYDDATGEFRKVLDYYDSLPKLSYPSWADSATAKHVFNPYYIVKADNGNLVIACQCQGQYDIAGGIIYSTDNGFTWNFAKDSSNNPIWYGPYNLVRYPNGKLIALGGTDGFFHMYDSLESTDGINWTPTTVAANLGGYSSNVIVLSNGKWLCHDQISEDNGKTWTSTDLDSNVYIYGDNEMYQLDNGTIVAGNAIFDVGNLTWKKAFDYQIAFANNEYLIGKRTDGRGVMLSTDFGKTWTDVNTDKDVTYHATNCALNNNTVLLMHLIKYDSTGYYDYYGYSRFTIAGPVEKHIPLSDLDASVGDDGVITLKVKS